MQTFLVLHCKLGRCGLYVWLGKRISFVDMLLVMVVLVVLVMVVLVVLVMVVLLVLVLVLVLVLALLLVLMLLVVLLVLVVVVVVWGVNPGTAGTGGAFWCSFRFFSLVFCTDMKLPSTRFLCWSRRQIWGRVRAPGAICHSGLRAFDHRVTFLAGKTFS